MRSPRFWSTAVPTFSARLLQPLGSAYAAATARRVAKPARYSAPIPVLCVGNLTAGGTGKTPAVVHLIKALQARGLKPHVLSRGYGGQEKGPLTVNIHRHRAAQVGDEPFMLAAFAPVTIANDRAAGAKAIADKGDADLIIMDDGFQNPDVSKTASLLVFDGAVGLGNGLAIPAGPLREDIDAGLARADAALIIGEDKTQVAARIGDACPQFTGALKAGPETMWLKGQRVTAFAGIGRPQKFFDTLEEIGAEVCGTFPFPDHHSYKAQDLLLIDRHCAKTGSIAVTTEKDAVRLPPSRQGRVSIVRVDLLLDDADAFINHLLEKLGLAA